MSSHPPGSREILGRRKVFAEVYGGCGERSTRLVSCTLGYKAGLIGAAMAAMQNAGD